MINQICISCNIELPINRFEHQNNRPNPRRKCKSCRISQRVYSEESLIRMKEYKKKYNIGNRNYLKNYALVKKYGIDLSKFNLMILQQNNKCGICSKEMVSKKKKHVDHDHNTGRVRDILCSTCNSGIGMLGDSIEHLNNAVKYLKRHELIQDNF